MNSEEFVQELLGPIQAFCKTLDGEPPSYSYIPLKSDEERIRVMKSRLFNELRAADLYGTWLRTTPELDVKATMAESAHEEMTHAGLLSKRIQELGYDPSDYRLSPPTNRVEALRLRASVVMGLPLVPWIQCAPRSMPSTV